MLVKARASQGTTSLAGRRTDTSLLGDCPSRSASTDAEARRRSRKPAALRDDHEPQVLDTLLPTTTPSPTRHRNLVVRAAPRKTASPKPPSKERVVALDRRHPKSRNVRLPAAEPASRSPLPDSFHGQQAPRSASLESCKWLPRRASASRGQDRRVAPAACCRPQTHHRRHSSARRQPLSCGHDRHGSDPESRVLARRTWRDKRGREPSPSIVSRLSIRVERRTLPKATLCSAVLLCVVVVSAFVVLLARKIPMYYAERRMQVCSTTDCLEHARRLLRKLNASADPCADFHAYVCGNDDGGLAAANDTQVLGVLVQPGLEENHSSTVTLKALMALERCSDRSGAGEAVGELREFMADRRIPWPEQPAENCSRLVDLLDVLLDLALNWRVALWFDVSVTYSSIHSSFVITMGELGPVAWQRMRQLSQVDDDTYAAFARNMSALLSNDSLGEADIEALRRHESMVRHTLLSLEPTDQQDTLVPLHKIGAVTGVIPSAQWMVLLKKHLNSDFNMTMHTEVLLQNALYLSRVFSLLRGISVGTALDVTGWMFAYIYAWTATSRLDGLNHVGTSGMDTYHLCFLAVHESFGLAHIASSFAREFRMSERHRISAILNWTSDALVDAIAHSQSLSNTTKDEAAAKIRTSAGRYFWPPEPFFHLDILDALYDNFPAQPDSFFAIWTKSREALRRSITNRYYGSLMTARYRWPLGTVVYVYSFNWLRVSLSAFYPPSYLRGGSSTMAFSGLGFQLARALVRAVDQHGRILDRAGRQRPWWGAQADKCAWDLAPGERQKRSVADLFALEVALSALKKSSGRSYSSLRIRGLESLSEAQTFFASYCSHFCGDPEGQRLCNLAANSTEFAGAFSCEPKERDKCLFV